jgi:hypothetical protein
MTLRFTNTKLSTLHKMVLMYKLYLKLRHFNVFASMINLVDT